MSTLSWCAAYLSNSIELCYMPNYNTNFSYQRTSTYFRKPIENTIFYNIKSTIFKKLKVLIMTLKEYPQRLKNIETLKIKRLLPNILVTFTGIFSSLLSIFFI